MKKIIQPGQHYSSPVFDEDNISEYRLSIGLSLDGFSFIVCDNKGNTVFLHSVYFDVNEHYTEIIPALKEHIKSFPWLSQLMEKKVALVDSTRFTLVPFSVYDSKYKETFFKLNHPLNEQDVIKDDMLKNYHSYLIYALNKEIRDMINLLIPGLYWKHYAKDLINCGSKDQSTRQITADVRNKRFYIVAFDDQRLKFCNAFRYNSKEDFVYFIVLVYKQLGFDPESVQLKLSGLIDQDSPILQLLKRYISKIQFTNTEDLMKDMESDANCPEYQYENLKNALFCE